MDAAAAILPIALTLALGWGTVAAGIVTRQMWDGIEVLSFRVLIPAVLFLAIARAELDMARHGALAVALWGTLGLASLLMIGAKAVGLWRVDAPGFTTLYQTTMRWNGFIALALARLWGGETAFAMVAVAMALLVPVINPACVLVLASYGAAKPTLAGILRTLARNPIIQASAAGLAFNLSGVAPPAPILNALTLVGDAALGVGILAVGAALVPKRLLTRDPRVWIGAALRPLLLPALFLAIAPLLALDPTARLMGVMVFAVPAATNGYILARQMGGDAPLYADILAVQTLLSLIALPLWMALA
ncbi:MAG: AEC family transporter [Rhodobacterales bacterium]|nr:MAG: AEC family transporter [Rhodobacterales bacterium]